MIRSQYFALRCAASLSPNLLRHNWSNERRERYLDAFDIQNTRRRVRTLRVPFMDQLDGCKDDMARRLLLGVSEQFEEPIEVEPMYVQRTDPYPMTSPCKYVSAEPSATVEKMMRLACGVVSRPVAARVAA